MDKIKLIKELDKLSVNVNPKNVFVIEYKGVRLTTRSNKSSWATLTAAKNALRLSLSNALSDWRKRLELIKELEEEGIIKYIKL